MSIIEEFGGMTVTTEFEFKKESPMKRNKVSIKSKIGVVISGFAKLADGLVNIFSLGNFNPELSYKWAKYRLRTGKFSDQ